MILPPAADRMIFEAIKGTAPVVELKLRRVCAWCKRLTAEGDPGASTSHGICETCFTNQFEDIEHGH